MSDLISYVHGVDEVPLRAGTIGAQLRSAARRFAGREALVSCQQDWRCTFAELDVAVDEVARGLLALGVARGERVAIWATNCMEWALVQYATARIGAILVTVNPAYRSAEAAFVLRQSGSRVLFSSLEHKSSDYVKLVAEAGPECPDLRHVVFLGTPDWQALIERGRDVTAGQLAAREAELHSDDVINIQYTSGTTGAPKGASLTHHGLLNNGLFSGRRCGFTESDRICVPVPYYHCFGMVLGNLAALTHGACVVLPGPSFEPAAALAAVQAERCTALYGVPTMFIAELMLPDFGSYDLTSLRGGIIAGAPCPVELMRRLIGEMHLADITIGYGMTETSPLSTQTRVNDSPQRRTETVGTAHPHTEVAVVDPETGRPVPRGTPGELRVRGYSVMRGYWAAEQASREAVDQAGWMHTGDLATMDRDGYVAIIGRIKDMIIRGGENIYPREIEDFLRAHPGVADVQVVGMPDPVYGEQAVAWIKAAPGAGVSAEEILAHCAGRLAHYKIPHLVRFLEPDEDFPMTVTGKVQKHVLRERAQQLG
ncbi:linear/branched/unsaturated fatty acid:CoA ligase LbuL [Pseudonocardia eucalypti]|uniref:Linear/branched/unsaturated fatty acid:CoA ligase LbuL n=1 Tax=Pseudonocardia eucalypti TaxID=648755 RepID=A0ABP9PNF2_9PSEU|nr:fatty-acyl-CoA synthase [Pseudonocardia eucalypti]